MGDKIYIYLNHMKNTIQKKLLLLQKSSAPLLKETQKKFLRLYKKIKINKKLFFFKFNMMKNYITNLIDAVTVNKIINSNE